jgi:hypothetical protein
MTNRVPEGQAERVRELKQSLQSLDFLTEDPSNARFHNHFPKTADTLTLILKAHLIAEESLYDIVGLFIHFEPALEDARLSFAQLLAMAKALTPFTPEFWLWGTLKELNTIRNRLAHHLDSPEIDAKIENLRVTIAQQRVALTDSSPFDDSLSGVLAYLLGAMTGLIRILTEAKRLDVLNLLRGVGK